MDLNIGHGALVNYFATRHRHDRSPMHLEREMVVYKPAGDSWHRTWTSAMRRWTGEGFIFLGEHIRPKPASEPAATNVTS